MPKWVVGLLGAADRAGMAVAPNLFAYQLVFEFEPAPKPRSR